MKTEDLTVLWFVPPTHKGKYPNIGQYRFYKNMPVRASIEYPYLNAMGVTQLDRAGFDVKFLDCPTMSLSWDQVDPFLKDADLIIMEARTPIVRYIYEVADKLRRITHAKVALYGDHVTWDPVEAANYCDHIIIGGDYDYGALKLAEALCNGIKPFQVFNAGLVENLDSLPHVDRELVPWNKYFEAWKIRDVYIYTMSGRGCRFNCKFCAWVKPFWGNRVRQRSVLDVVSEFEEAYKRYGKCYIWDDHDCFDTGWGASFARALIAKGYVHKEIHWAFQTHSNMIRNLEDLKLMRKAGLHLVKLGIESGNQTTLNMIRKGATVEDHVRAITLLKEADVRVHANMMVGFPWETRKEAYQTIEWIKKVDPDQAQFSLAIPYPWTDLYDYAKSNGLLLVADGDWESFDATHAMMQMVDMTPEEVAKLYRDCWDKFYLNWHYKWKHIKTLRNLADLKQLLRGYYSIRFGHMRAMKN